jgi:RNA recognition motif-containing protein
MINRHLPPKDGGFCFSQRRNPLMRIVSTVSTVKAPSGAGFEEFSRMEAKLYVGNLSYDTTEDEIRNLFSQAGTVTDVALIKDRDTGSSKGFAFVTMSSQEEANNAIQQFNGRSLGNRDLTVNIARPREERPRGGGYGGGGGRGGGGGYRGGSQNRGGGNRGY